MLLLNAEDSVDLMTTTIGWGVPRTNLLETAIQWQKNMYVFEGAVTCLIRVAGGFVSTRYNKMVTNR